MDSTSRERSARWRDRRRVGAVSVTVDVLPEHRRALERMGLIPAGHDKHPSAIAWAVARFLDTTAAVNAIGVALYPDWPEDEADVETETPSPESSGKNGE